ncbi:MAG: hypothetical protein HY749_03840 [Gammaproteobacteria bacterium]|nr:hypothetical protein [Gammaproteobacteria bacterium]
MDQHFVPVDPRGSTWHCWDPHVHTPGTALNDQYRGLAPWDDFFAKLEASEPPIRAIGVTDYCSIDGYVETLRRKRCEHLGGVGLMFPNVEFRLSIETSKGGAVNLHLLFSPHDPDHIDSIRRFLTALTFSYQGDTFRCERVDLVRLGRVHNPALVDEEAAYREGVKQFKLNPTELGTALKNNAWAQDNCLIAVAGSCRDGTSGLHRDTHGRTLWLAHERISCRR